VLRAILAFFIQTDVSNTACLTELQSKREIAIITSSISQAGEKCLTTPEAIAIVVRV